MASTYSPLLRFELIGSGDQSGLWGTTTNGNLGTLVEQAIAGVASIVLASSSDYTLQSLNGTSDEARCAVLSFSGATGGTTNIIIPASQKLYVVRNATGSSLVIKTSAQVGGVTVADANSTLVFCNGINALAGIQSSSLADVVGPGSSTDNAFTRFDGTTGKIIQNSTGATMDDNGAPTFTGTVQINPQSTTVGAQIKLLEGSTSGTNFVAFKAPNALSSDVTWTLPSADATVSGQYLASNAAGTLSWVTPSSASGTVTSVSGTGTASGLSLSGTVTTSGNLTLSGTVSVSSPTGTLPVGNGGTGSSTLAGAGIVTTTGTQSIAGNKTFSGLTTFTDLSYFTTSGAGASFGASTPNGNYAIYVKPASSSSGYGGLIAQNNSAVIGIQSFTDTTSAALTAYYYGTPGGGATGVGSVTTNGSATAYNTSSDYRLKENIAPLANAVSRVKQLAPKNFSWKNNPGLGTVEGFIAHELQRVSPDAVHGEKDAVDGNGNPVYQGIDTSVLVPLLTAALQEALARIEVLEAKVG